MSRIIQIVIFCLILTGCPANPADSTSTEEEYKTKCIDGVTYIFFDNGTYNQGFGYMSAKYDKDTKQVVTCG